MPNKFYGDVNSDYFVEGAKDSGYVKKSKSGYPGDSGANPKSMGWDEQRDNDSSNWFEGKKASVGKGEAS